MPVSSLNLLLLSSFLIAVRLPLFLYIFIRIVVFCLLVASFLFFLFTDVFQSEMWCEFSAAFPNHLQPLVSRVQETVLASKAEGTIRTYLAGFKRWKLWASSNCFCHVPANSFHVAAYLQCLISEANSPSPVLNAVYSIDWAQRLAGLPKVSDHPIVSSMNRPRQTNFVTERGLQSRGRIKTRALLRRWSNTLLPQKSILVRICRCLELYRPLDPPPRSGAKA